MNKKFNCVAMKNEIQAQMLREEAGLSAADRAQAMRNALERSQSPIGELWRKLRVREQARITRVAEDSANYGTKS